MNICINIFTVISLLFFLGCDKAVVKDTVKEIPTEFLGEWRLESYDVVFLDSTYDDSATIVKNASTMDYSEYMDDNSNFFVTLLFVERDSLVIFARHCSGDQSGIERSSFPFAYKDGFLLSKVLTDTLTLREFSEFTGNPVSDITGTVEMSTAVSLKESLLNVVHYMTIYQDDKPWKFVQYVSARYHRFSNNKVSFEDPGTCDPHEYPSIFISLIY